MGLLLFLFSPDSAVRIDLIEQLPHVAMICQEAPERLGDVLPRHLIQIINTFLRDDDQQVSWNRSLNICFFCCIY